MFFPLVVMMDRGSGDRKWARTYDGANMYVKRAVFSPDGTRVATFIGYSVGFPMDSRIYTLDARDGTALSHY